MSTTLPVSPGPGDQTGNRGRASPLRLIDGLFSYAVAFVATLASDRRQRLGDLVARTLVIRRTP